MVKLSTDKHAQPSFMRDACDYVLVGLCDHTIGTNQQYSSIGSGYGFALTRRQAIILINDG